MKPDSKYNWPLWDPRDFGPYDGANYREPRRWQTVAAAVLLLLAVALGGWLAW